MKVRLDHPSIQVSGSILLWSLAGSLCVWWGGGPGTVLVLLLSWTPVSHIMPYKDERATAGDDVDSEEFTRGHGHSAGESSGMESEGRSC
jgi:hypothetical protein